MKNMRGKRKKMVILETFALEKTVLVWLWWYTPAVSIWESEAGR
jgi:hypothetical protein